MSEEARVTPKKRRASLWKWLLLSLVGHALVIVAASPSLFQGEEASQTPEALYERAEVLESEGKFAESEALLQKVVDMRPKIQLPAVFDEAEKKLKKVRLKALEERREREREAAREAEGGAPEDDGDAGAGDGAEDPGDGSSEGSSDGGEEAPESPVDVLPELPDL